MATDSNDYMLSTVDNPFNPFTQWYEWYAYDAILGYHTSAYLARIMKTSNELLDVDQEFFYRDAVEEIIRENPLQVYCKVFRPEINSSEGGEGSREIDPPSASPVR
jgi:hypothetical protein